jgi:basic amino acid/polyamine antiporter, APA family
LLKNSKVMMESSPPLNRVLSLPMMIFFGLGNILGAGIYVLTGKVAGHAAMYTPLSFLIAALATVFTAFSYAELTSRYPVSAGAAVFVKEGFNLVPLSLFVGLLIIFTGVISAATVARGSVGYLQFFIGLPGNVLIIIILVTLGTIAAWGVKQSAALVVLISALEIFGLLIVIFTAGNVFTEIPTRMTEFIPDFNWSAFKGISVGAFLAFYAYVGYEDMANMAEEVNEPVRNLPYSILFSLAIATILYMAVSAVSVLTVAPVILAQSDAPLAAVYKQATGSEPVLLSAISVVAVINGALIQIIMASRVCYGMSKRGWLPRSFSIVHPSTRTPVIATVIITALILVMALWLPLETLARATSTALLVIFTLVNLALLNIKRNQVAEDRIFTVSPWIPIAGFLVSICFLSLQFVG